jgi:hypothetical protein
MQRTLMLSLFDVCKRTQIMLGGADDVTSDEVPR